MRRLFGALVVVAIATVACGKSEAEKQAEQVADQAKKVAAAAEQAGKAAPGGAEQAKGMADMAKAMQGMAAAMGGGSPDGKPVEPVSLDALKSVLPQMPGWEMSTPKSERMTAPVAFSQTETEYNKGDTEVQLKVIDTGYAQLLVAPWAMMLASGYSRETDDGYEKATTISGNPGFEKWNKASKRGELNIFVNKRFMVTIEGDNLPNINALQEFASKMDFGKVAAMK